MSLMHNYNVQRSVFKLYVFLFSKLKRVFLRFLKRL